MNYADDKSCMNHADKQCEHTNEITWACPHDYTEADSTDKQAKLSWYSVRTAHLYTSPDRCINHYSAVPTAIFSLEIKILHILHRENLFR